MKALKVLGIAGAGVMLGVLATPAPEPPEPKVRVLTIKTPPKIISKKEVVTEYKVHPIPETCETSLDYTGLSTDESNDVYNRVQKFFNHLDTVTARKIEDPLASRKT